MERRLVAALAALALSWVACGRERASDDRDRTAEAPGSPEALARPAPGATSGPREPAAVVPADAPLVVFFGDSLTAGLHLEPSEAFPARLQRRLASEGVPFRLVDAGVSGDTSAGGLRRIDWVLKQRPDILVLELGGNDGLRTQPVAEVEQRLGQMIARAQAAGARVLLLGMRLPPNLGRDYAQAFEALYPRLAEEHGCAFVPFFMEGAAGDPRLMLEDGIHPNAAGHARLAENVAPELRRLVREASAER